ncbi:MAG: S1C family serine protease [Anaerolineae bacterium]
MNKNFIIGCLIALIIAIVLCGVTAIAGVLLFRATTIVDSGVSLNDSAPTAIVEMATAGPAPTLEKASVPTLPSAKGNLSSDVRPQVAGGDDLSALYTEVEPGVVAIQTFVQTAGQLGGGSGSGFIIDDSGLIVTNEHVIADASRVEVIYFDGTSSQASVLGSDVDSDLAVLKVDRLPDNVHTLPLGDSDSVLPGQWVVAIGNPYGLHNTITYGIVSAIGRMIPARVGSYSIPQAIQTDAAINPGNSGGPLINMEGQVIGVNAQIRTDGTSSSNAGIGFAIPVNIVRRVVPYLSEGDAYPWPWIGISGSDVDMLLVEAGNLEVRRGAYVATITAGSPADKAGLRGSTGTREFGSLSVPVGGDVIVAANGEPVYDFADLLETVAFGMPGDDVDLTVLRDGREMQITVTLEQRPAH